MSWDRIATDPNVCFGKARAEGTRMTVEFVLKLMSNGYTAEDIVHAYPELTTYDVYQCVSYGSWLASERAISIS